RVLASVQMAWFHGRRGRANDSKASLAETEALPPASYVGQKAFEGITTAYVAVVAESNEGRAAALEVGRRARKQGAHRWARVADLLAAANDAREEFGSTIRRLAVNSPWNVTYVADLVCRRLDELD